MNFQDESKMSISERTQRVRNAFLGATSETKAKVLKLATFPIESVSGTEDVKCGWDQRWDQSWPQSFVQGW